MHRFLLRINQYSECPAIARMVLIKEFDIGSELGAFLLLCRLELHPSALVTRMALQILLFFSSLCFFGLAALLLLDRGRGSLEQPHITKFLVALATNFRHFKTLTQVDVCVLGYDFDKVFENNVMLVKLLLQSFDFAVDFELLLFHRVKLK